VKSISETEYMVPGAQELLERAAEMVRHLPDEVDPAGVRCHELARAVATCLIRRDPAWEQYIKVIDGTYDHVDHSWIYLLWGSGYVLDVYTVGRLPQVQLVQSHSLLQGTRALYKAGSPRQDIRSEVVEAMLCALGVKTKKIKLSKQERRALKEFGKPRGRRNYHGVHGHTIHSLERKGLIGSDHRLTAAGRKELVVPNVFDDLFEARAQGR
jgi:hypothetical protein